MSENADSTYSSCPNTRVGRALSVGARQAAHRELDAPVSKLAPALHLGHVGGLRKSLQDFTRLLARGYALQHERFAAEGPGGATPLLGDARRVSLRDVGRPADAIHRDTLSRN